MFGSTALDTALGLTFLYLLLSLLVTAINEQVEAVLKVRAKNLEAGMKELLGGSAANSTLVAGVYNHPLIAGLFAGEYGHPKTPARLPSYIPARSFALALMDVIAPVTPARPSGADGATVEPLAAPPAAAPDGLARLKVALERSLPAAAGMAAADGTAAVPADVARAVLALVEAAGADAAQARQNIEDWFNAAMDRASGWYKQHVHRVTLVVGLVLTVAVNADTVAVADGLARDPAVRAAVVAAASKKTTLDQIAADVNTVKGYGWPLGWAGESDPRVKSPTTTWGWACKLFGWLVTVYAVSLGAPFWFDTLTKLNVIRSAVKPKEKPADVPPADRR